MNVDTLVIILCCFIFGIPIAFIVVGAFENWEGHW